MGKIYFHCHDANAFKDYHFWPWPMDKGGRYFGFYEVRVSKNGVTNPKSLLGEKIYTLVGVTQETDVVNINFPEKKWVTCREYFVWQHIVVEEFEENDSHYFFRGPLFHAKTAFRLNDLESFQEMVKEIPVDGPCLFAVEENQVLGKISSQMEYVAFSQRLDEEMEYAKFWHEKIDYRRFTDHAMMRVLIGFEPLYIFDDTTVELEWFDDGWMWR